MKKKKIKYFPHLFKLKMLTSLKHGYVAAVDDAAHIVAGGLGPPGGNGDLGAHQSVGQGGFARVGAPNEAGEAGMEILGNRGDHDPGGGARVLLVPWALQGIGTAHEFGVSGEADGLGVADPGTVRLVKIGRAHV